MEAILLPIISICYRRPPTLDQQIVQGLTDRSLGILREDPREDPRGDEFPPVSDNDSSQSLIVRTTANGALDLRVGSNLAPGLLEQAVAAVHSITMVQVREAKSRAICNTVVQVMAIAAFAFVALRSRP